MVSTAAAAAIANESPASAEDVCPVTGRIHPGSNNLLLSLLSARNVLGGTATQAAVMHRTLRFLHSRMLPACGHQFLCTLERVDASLLPLFIAKPDYLDFENADLALGFLAAGVGRLSMCSCTANHEHNRHQQKQ
jgi:hypothetical protein